MDDETIGTIVGQGRYALQREGVESASERRSPQGDENLDAQRQRALQRRIPIEQPLSPVEVAELQGGDFRRELPIL